VSKEGQTITAQKIVWWALVTLTGIVISIAGGWVGSVNAFMPATTERIARQEASQEVMFQAVSTQYTTIIKELQRRPE